MLKRYVLSYCSGQTKKRKKNDKALSGVSNTDIEKFCTKDLKHSQKEVEGGNVFQIYAEVSILYMYVNEREIKEWSSEDIDFILRCGDEVYQCVRQYCIYVYSVF